MNMATMELTARQRELSEMQPEAFCAGLEAERKRCSALAAMGEAADAPLLAARAIADAAVPADCVDRFRVCAKKNGNERKFERAVTMLGVKPSENAAGSEPATDKDQGDEVLSEMLALRGHRPTA
jgi:hypothetical protein